VNKFKGLLSALSPKGEGAKNFDDSSSRQVARPAI